MKKIINIEGMSCGHCQGAVEKALNNIAGVSSAKVNLKKKRAAVKLSAEISDDIFKNAVENAGFQVISIE